MGFVQRVRGGGLMLPPLFAESAGEANQKLVIITERVAKQIGADHWAIHNADPCVRRVRARNERGDGRGYWDYWDERNWYVTMLTDCAVTSSQLRDAVSTQAVNVTRSLNGSPLNLDDCEFALEHGLMRIALWVSARVREEEDEH
jgi:hypothetical protein